MTQGQGEGKVKLHAMNLVVAGSPLTDMGSVFIILIKIWWSIRNTFAFHDRFLPFLPGEKKIHGILVNSVVHVGRGRDSRKIGGTLGPLHTR